ncbi:MAG: SIR2 family protein [FCB group bacterium]|jgi:hypothetical protein|nr:SIR2 family protein [FCB group bacterium]
MRLAFLFGSGVSVPAGMPTTGEIAERIFSGYGVARHTDESYYFGPPLYPDIQDVDDHVTSVVAFLNLLEDERRRFYGDLYRVNYEDAAYMASQLADSEAMEFENPVTLALIEKLESSPVYRETVVKRWMGNGHESYDVHSIARETVNYIKCVVCGMLWTQPLRMDHLGFLRDAHSEFRMEQVDIFTLNNDLLLETYLRAEELTFIDGFTEPINDVRYWDRTLYEEPSASLRLFKLHGSLGCYQYDDGIGIASGNSHTRITGRDGSAQYSIFSTPLILVGTFNKMLQYTMGFFADLFVLFYTNLHKADALIVCGYGFGDKGINTQVLEWLRSSTKKRMVIIHPEPLRLKECARGAVKGHWDALERSGQLVIISRKIEEISWEDVASVLA